MRLAFNTDGVLVGLILDSTPARLAKLADDRAAEIYVDEGEQPDLCQSIMANASGCRYRDGALSLNGKSVEIRQPTGTRAAELPDLIDTAIAQVEAGQITSLAKLLPIVKLILRGMKLILRRLR